jgi:hypothetical protein
MNAILSLFKKLNASSAELRALEADLQKELDAADLRLSELERSRRALLIDGTLKQVADLDNEMASVRFTAERSTVMIEELQPRIQAAEKAEHAKLLEETAADLQAKNRKLRDIYLQIDEAAVTFHDSMIEGRALYEQIQNGNRLLANNGRTELKVTIPIFAAAEILKRNPESFPPYLYFQSPISKHPDRGLIIDTLRKLDL